MLIIAINRGIPGARRLRVFNVLTKTGDVAARRPHSSPGSPVAGKAPTWGNHPGGVLSAATRVVSALRSLLTYQIGTSFPRGIFGHSTIVGIASIRSPARDFHRHPALFRGRPRDTG